MDIIDIADLDVIFLTYDEPKKEEFWIKIQNIAPWAKRVDGVKGSDNAHKAAGEASDTDRFVLIDGDNLPDPDFFNVQLEITDENRDCVFRWRARNEINGLMYGNGGISCWTKDFVANMRTHENSDGSDDTAVEFCFDDKYWALHNCYSTTYPNQTAFQAWRAGFREGVKMCLDKGAKPALTDFEKKVHSRNFDNLQVWQNIGRDVDNGVWAIYGARLGTQMTMLTDWDFTKVQDFDELDKLWLEYKDKDPDEQSQEIGRLLQNRLGLPCANMSAEESKFFKHHMTGKHFNIKPMIREIDIIRIIEGW
jgi:hypothetical protein